MDPKFKVALVGPSGVGKTTLITAVFSDTQDRLAGTSLEIVLDGPTKVRVNKHNKELRSALDTKVFDSTALQGQQSIENLGISLRSLGDATLEIPFDILDYPGGWLDPAVRQAGGVSDGRWAQCEAHIRSSILTLIPIDAAVLMEAQTPSQRASAAHGLGIVDVEELVQLWARSRNLEENRDEPAVLMLVPIKCEKYFDLGRGPGSDAAALRERVRGAYNGVLETVRKEARDRSIRVVYNPVDTYGCVQLVDGVWSNPTGVAEHSVFRGTYRFIGNSPQIKVRAASAVMRELCRCLLDGQKRQKEQDEQVHEAERRGIQARISEPKGFWGTIAYYWSGEARQNKIGVGEAENAVERARRHRAQLDDDLRTLANMAEDSRSEEWTAVR